MTFVNHTGLPYFYSELNNKSMSNIQEEIWKDVKGFKGLYLVSNLGRVKSLYNAIKMRHKGDILTQSESAIRNNKGYKSLVLYKNRKKFNRMVQMRLLLRCATCIT